MKGKCGDKKLLYICQVCKKPFSTLENLTSHKSLFHQNPCFICKVNFDKKTDVDKHITETHEITRCIYLLGK